MQTTLTILNEQRWCIGFARLSNIGLSQRNSASCPVHYSADGRHLPAVHVSGRTGNLRRPGWWVPLLLVWLCALPAVADEPAQPAKLTTALIDLDRTEFGGLVESKLLAIDEVSWLERGEIDRVLQEQTLQRLFAGDGTSERMQLGGLLKAQVLVLIRRLPPHDTHPHRYELVTCQTQGGLRLFRTELTATDNAQADADQAAGLIAASFARARQPARILFAVPPFVSNDLEYDHDYLKAAYTKLIEELLLAQPGVLVVELDEAQSIAREYQLAADTARPLRLLPYYILGDYRNHRLPEGRRVDLTVSLRHGAQDLAKIQRTGIDPDAAPEVLRTLTAELLSSSVIETSNIMDPAVEARQLAERAQAFRKLGNYSEAISLIEAAVLLQPEDLSLREQILLAYDRFYEDYGEVQNTHEERAVQELIGFSRAIEHLELVLRAKPEEATRKDRFGGLGIGGVRVYMRLNGSIFESVRVLESQVLDQAKQALIRICMGLARSQHAGAEDYLRIATEHDRKVEKYDAIERVIHDLSDEPGITELTIRFVKIYDSVKYLDNPAGIAFLERLASSNQSAVREAGLSLLADLNQSRNIPRARWHPREDNPADDPAEVIFEPLRIRISSKKSSLAVKELRTVDGCLPISPEIDLIWMGRLYLMRQRGVAEEVELPFLEGFIKEVKFDGKYVWVVVESPQHDWRLVYCDLATGESRVVSSEAGLPTTDVKASHGTTRSRPMTVAPIEPGRVCVVGSFGRAWIALVDVLASTSPRVDVIHEARDVYEPNDARAYRNSEVSFVPLEVETLTGLDDQSARKQVLVWRAASGNTGSEMEGHPLVVDIDSRTVRLLTGPVRAVSNLSKMIAVHSDAMFQVRPHPLSRQINLWRHQLPTLDPQLVLADVPQGVVRILGNELHIIGKKWWSLDMQQPSVRLRAFVPWDYQENWRYPGRPRVSPSYIESQPGKYQLHDVISSAHYGFLVRVSYLYRFRSGMMHSEAMLSAQVLPTRSTVGSERP